MSIEDWISDTLTPYGSSIAVRVIVLAEVVVALTSMGGYIPAPVAFGVVVVLGLAGYLAWSSSWCPKCTKPADEEYLFKETSRLGGLERRIPGFLGWTKLWPDRVCSNCGYQLYRFPEQQDDR